MRSTGSHLSLAASPMTASHCGLAHGTSPLVTSPGAPYRGIEWHPSRPRSHARPRRESRQRSPGNNVAQMGSDTRGQTHTSRLFSKFPALFLLTLLDT